MTQAYNIGREINRFVIKDCSQVLDDIDQGEYVPPIQKYKVLYLKSLYESKVMTFLFFSFKFL